MSSIKCIIERVHLKMKVFINDCLFIKGIIILGGDFNEARREAKRYSGC